MNYSSLVERNAGLINDQDCLRNSTIAIAGCGAEGGGTAITLARMGVCNFKLAEPDFFEAHNGNRQFGASIKTLGKNKAAVIRSEVCDINPDANVEVFDMGINSVNIDRFLDKADIVVDAIDYRSPIHSALLHRKSRERNIPVFVGLSIGWGSYIFFFDPNGFTFEEYVGLEKDCELTLFENYSYPLLAFCPEPPLYVGKKLIRQVIAEEREIPVIAPAVDLTAAELSSYIYFYLSEEKKIKPAPYYYSTGDIFLGKPKKVSLWKKILLKIIADL